MNNNGVFFYGSGVGTTGNACDSRHVSVKLDHVEIYGVDTAIQLVGAQYTESEMIALDVGNVNQFINADSGSVIVDLAITGSILQIGNTVTNVPMVDYEGACTGTNGSLLLNVNDWVGSGGAFTFNSSNMKKLVIGTNKIAYANTTPYWAGVSALSERHLTNLTLQRKRGEAVHTGSNSARHLRCQRPRGGDHGQ